MNRLSVLGAALVLLGGQASATEVSTTDAASPVKTAAAFCAAPAKADRVAKPKAKVNSCATKAHSGRLGSVPLVFAAAALTGVVVIGVSTKHDNNPASP